MARKPTVWTLGIADVDKFPKAARDALCDSSLLGIGHPEMRIMKAPGKVMAERIRRADKILQPGDNMSKVADGISLRKINTILLGDPRKW